MGCSSYMPVVSYFSVSFSQFSCQYFAPRVVKYQIKDIIGINELSIHLRKTSSLFPEKYPVAKTPINKIKYPVLDQYLSISICLFSEAILNFISSVPILYLPIYIYHTSIYLSL